MEIRKAQISDLNDIAYLEKTSFDPSRQMSLTSLKNSLSSQHQEVYVVKLEEKTIGYAIIFIYHNMHRLYSIAIDSNYRGQGFGKKLLNFIIENAKKNNIEKISLEVDANNLSLLRFYESFGFKIICELKDYYGVNQPAYRMHLYLTNDCLNKNKILNYVVTDIDIPWLKDIKNIHIIDVDTYLTDEKFQKIKNIRIFNLCSSYQYQSLGYYVSLLATARLQRVIPNVATIKDFSDQLILKTIGEEAYNLIQKTLKDLKTNSISIVSYFGYTPIKKYQKLIKSLYNLFEAPFINFTFEKGINWKLEKVEPISITQVETDNFIKEAAINYFSQKRFSIPHLKDYKYDLAILIDPNETNPPSNKIALTKFKIAAEKMGFFTEFITKEDYHRLSEFDALFIRTTTNVNDYTYQFSRYAYAEGLIVIDDPWSILKCSNKIFFTESMKKLDIPTPKTFFVSKKSNLNEIINELKFPIILKQPDSSFSLGVFKVNNYEELKEKLDFLFTKSDLIVAQEFIQSEYDWRVGILDNKVLFVSKYHMAKNHWQIYNWQTKLKKDQAGSDESVKIEDTPPKVLEYALKAASAMGDGFYGVDLKVTNNQIYVIEVNDNPSIDYKVEDQLLGDELYYKIIKTIYDRIEDARNSKPNNG